MKKIKFYVLTLLLFFVFESCKNTKDTNNNERLTNNNEILVDTVIVADTNKQEKENDLKIEFTSKYICPNHCKGSGSENEGKCPVCGMDYIENPDFEQ